MESLLLVFYVLLAVAIVALILLQQGRGADIGASFGSGASQTLFGSAGAGNVLSRSTAILSALFFAASVGLAVAAKHKAEAAREGGVPVPEVIETRDNSKMVDDLPGEATEADDTGMPAADDIPTVEASASGDPASGESGELPAEQ